MRVGLGFDQHRFEKGRKLILGGVEIPYEKGLLGHSDADVLVHALMDALLGAAGLKDIGYYFPPSDMQYKDISSMILLKKVIEMVKQEGWEVNNIDCALFLEEPKILSYVDQLKKNIAAALGITEREIGIKATSPEGLGALGEKKGASAWAVALLIKGLGR